MKDRVDKLIPCIILAGGKSKRMEGIDKALVKLDGMTLIERVLKKTINEFEDIFVIVKDEKQKNEIKKSLRMTSNKISIFSDDSDVISPLSGIKFGIEKTNSDFFFLIACDMPMVSQETIKKLLNTHYEERKNSVNKTSDCIIFQRDGYIEPFCAIYKKEVFLNSEVNDSLKSCIEKTENKKILDLENSDEFMNINTDHDLEKAESYMRNFKKI